DQQRLAVRVLARDAHLAARDEVEALALLARVNEVLARREGPRLEERDHGLALRRRDRAEDRAVPKQVRHHPAAAEVAELLAERRRRLRQGLERIARGDQQQ